MPKTEPKAGLELTTLRSRPELRPRVGCSTDWATQAPLQGFFFFFFLKVFSWHRFPEIGSLSYRVDLNPLWNEKTGQKLWLVLLPNSFPNYINSHSTSSALRITHKVKIIFLGSPHLDNLFTGIKKIPWPYVS